MFENYRKFIALIVAIICTLNSIRADDDPENKEALKCIVQYLNEKGIHEELLASVDTSSNVNQECERLRNKKIEKGFGKVDAKLRADEYFKKYANCIMEKIKTEENRNIILRREAIKVG